MATQNRKRIEKLWMKDPHCHWCKRLTVLSESGECRNLADTATYDHLYTRFHPERQSENGYLGVLSCRECNCERGRIDFLKAMPLPSDKWEFNAYEKGQAMGCR